MRPQANLTLPLLSITNTGMDEITWKQLQNAISWLNLRNCSLTGDCKRVLSASLFDIALRTLLLSTFDICYTLNCWHIAYIQLVYVCNTVKYE